MLGIVAVYLAGLLAAQGAAGHVALLRLRRGQAPGAGVCAPPALLSAADRAGAAAEQGAARGARAAPGGHADGAWRWCASLTACCTSTRARASPAATRRSAARVVLGAGEAARLLVAGIHHQGWIVLGLLDDDPDKQGARIAGVPVLGPLDAMRDRAALGAATHLIVAHAVGARRAPARGARAGRDHRAAGGDGAVGRRAARRQSAHRPRCATSSPKTCSAASRCSSTRPASPRRCAARPC